MPISYEKTKGAYRFSFKRKIDGRVIRASKLLPKAWDEATAYAFDVKETARLVALHNGLLDSRPLIEKAVYLYLSEHAIHLKSLEEYEREYATLLPYYQGKRFDELPQIVIAINKNTAWSEATRSRKAILLGAACNYGYKFHNMGQYKPTDKLKIPRPNNAREYAPSRLEMLKLARATNSRELRCVIITAFYSGMRKSEILRATTDGAVFKLYDTKNKSTRFIPVHPKLKAYLKRFPLRIDKHSTTYYWNKVRKELKLEHYHFHDLRHSAATELINSGADLYTVGKVLGHRDVNSTKRYAHLTVDFMKEAIDRISRKRPT